MAKKAGALLQALEDAKRASLGTIIDRELNILNSGADITSLEAVLRALYEFPSYSAYNAEVPIKTAGAAKTVDRDEVELIQGLKAWWESLGGSVSIRNDSKETVFVCVVHKVVQSFPASIRPPTSGQSLRRRMADADAIAGEWRETLAQLKLKLHRAPKKGN